ncbi:MAG: HAD family hydrolase [Chitinophagaceae bacterium]|nr:HAD family hydrolase [Chitinophagaceae bacterium]
MPFKVIAFDADDTLWVNEPYFREAEDQFSALLEDYLPHHSATRELYKTELQNIPLYGYGVKGFMLSMVETALRVSDNTVPHHVIEKAIQFGKDLLAKPVELLEGVPETLSQLKGKYRLVMATKGDLLDQERKLKKSGLEAHFHHIEIMSDKQEADYQSLIRHLDIAPEEFVMIGNSLKSDVLPVLSIGGHAIHVPYHTTWEHEKVEGTIEHARFHSVETLKDILPILAFGE